MFWCYWYDYYCHHRLDLCCRVGLGGKMIGPIYILLVQIW